MLTPAVLLKYCCNVRFFEATLRLFRAVFPERSGLETKILIPLENVKEAVKYLPTAFRSGKEVVLR